MTINLLNSITFGAISGRQPLKTEWNLDSEKDIPRDLKVLEGRKIKITMVTLQNWQPQRIPGREKTHTWAVMMGGFHPERTTELEVRVSHLYCWQLFAFIGFSLGQRYPFPSFAKEMYNTILIEESFKPVCEFERKWRPKPLLDVAFLE